MALYDYKCDKCDKIMEVAHSMFDESSQLCPSCGSELYKVYMVAPRGFLNEPRTVGGLADRNASQFSDERKHEINEKAGITPKKEKQPSWMDQYRTKTNKQVRGMSPKDRKKYVLTGK